MNSAPGINSEVRTFGYDTYSRLTSELSLFSSFNSQLYTPGYDLFHAYDYAGNLTGLRKSRVDLPDNLSYNKDNQLNSQTANGNGDATGYGDYDASSRLLTAKLPSGPAFTAGYFAGGHRAWKQTSSNNKRFYYLYDGDTVVAELDAAGNWTNAFAYGASGLVERQSAGRVPYYIYTYDTQGNVVERLTTTNRTFNYAVDYISFYDAFGTERSQIAPDRSPSAYQDMVGYKGQFGAWTDNETDPVTGMANNYQIRSPAVWTGERYYDPAFARHLTRETYRETENAAWAINPYIADPNPLGHTLGGVLAGTAGGYFGGPVGSAVSVGSWETLYSLALGEPLDTALTQGIVAGVTDFAVGKVFHYAAGGIGAGVKSVMGRFGAKTVVGEAVEATTEEGVARTLSGTANSTAHIALGRTNLILKGNYVPSLAPWAESRGLSHFGMWQYAAFGLPKSAGDEALIRAAIDHATSIHINTAQVDLTKAFRMDPSVRHLSTEWEIQYILEKGYLYKTSFYIPAGRL